MQEGQLLKINPVHILICACLVLSAFLGGMYLGRNMRGEEIQVSSLASQLTPGKTPSVPSTAQNKKININTADIQSLMQLEGIGPTLAQRIINYREANGPFKRIEDIMNVPDIGEKRFLQIKDYITTGG